MEINKNLKQKNEMLGANNISQCIAIQNKM